MRALAAQTDLIFARVAIAAEELPRVLPERDGEKLKARFRAALGVPGRAKGTDSSADHWKRT